MKTLKQHISEALKISKNLSEWSSYSCQPKTKEELQDIILDRISQYGTKCDLNDIDTSFITDMSYLFMESSFNGDISKWDVSKVQNMEGMFEKSVFNGDISDWDVSKVQNMEFMFVNSKFNQDISSWKINKYCNALYIFIDCPIKEEYKPKLPK